MTKMAEKTTELRAGGCLCGAVRFEGVLSDRGVQLCHCKMCRALSSGPFHTVKFVGGVTLTERRGLKWFESSDWGRRGFCGECGATLFWSMKGADDGRWPVSAGALDEDVEQPLSKHIFVDHAPGYYAFADDAPRLTQAEVLAGAARKSGGDGS